ncbi:MAG: response regulator [Chloroflexi bacterium]|nr:response regulator [Chloroflexota bacterium]
MAKKILVINDTQEILQLFAEILNGEGYEVALHSYSTRDIDVVKRAAPDLIISDHPPTDEKQAWQFLQKLKMTRETSHIPVVLCTTNSKTIIEGEGHLAAKGVIVVLKPFDIEDLIGAVETQIGKAWDPTNQGMTDMVVDIQPEPSKVNQ